MMNVRQERLATIEARLGVNGDPCPICAHRPGAHRCMSPEEEAELDARFKEALDEMMESNAMLKRELAEAKGEK